jgi:hypothetical protein
MDLSRGLGDVYKRQILKLFHTNIHILKYCFLSLRPI